MAYERRGASQGAFRRYIGSPELAIGILPLYRAGFILCGDLSDSRASVGRLVAQFNHLGVVVGLAITGRAGIALTYDLGMRRAIQKSAKIRSLRTDYLNLLSILHRGFTTGS